MKLQLKEGVVTDVMFELAVALGWIKAKWEEQNLGEFTITSLKDGQHMAGSQHRQDQPIMWGEAADIRTRHHFSVVAQVHHPNIVNFARKLQEEGFRVVLHPDFMPGTPHLHIGLGEQIVVRVD